jgi:hypothetical protein
MRFATNRISFRSASAYDLFVYESILRFNDVEVPAGVCYAELVDQVVVALRFQVVLDSRLESSQDFIKHLELEVDVLPYA